MVLMIIVSEHEIDCLFFLVFHPFRSCILTFDSLSFREKETVLKHVREYLTCEYAVKMDGQRIFDAVNMPGQAVRSPQQPNFVDCGLFTLQNIEQFFTVNFQCFFFSLLLLFLKKLP